MLILVSTSSVLTMFGQAWSKSAFAVTLLRPGITTGWHRWVLWFVLVSLNVYSIITFFLQWTNYCGETPYSWKMPVVCAPYTTIFKIKTGGNSKWPVTFSGKSQANTGISVEYYHRFRSCFVPLASNLAAEDQTTREDRDLPHHEPRSHRCRDLDLADSLHDVSWGK